MNQTQLCYVIIFTILCLHAITYFLSFNQRIEESAKEMKIIEKKETKHRIVKVLLWTTWFSIHWRQKPKINCSGNEIHLSNDPYDMSQYDAIVFHLYNVHSSDLPKKHSKHQKWVLYNLETPENSKHQNVVLGLYLLERSIDWIWTFRRDSDIFNPYGFAVKTNGKLTEESMYRMNLNYSNYKGSVYSVVSKLSKNSKVGKLKAKQIVWFVSHCNAYSNRDDFVKLLSRGYLW
ncbi:Alpha-(1:3)-fucosyltransferase C-like protein [Leptotrombidium deliense]|uniref:Alpha-(1:3)-fucosyltransferase C-like protein n=1 Tax=Leptotrombidium deliense TaxID=299467 RepID=A0A443SBB2_9ACAR|nr:Alpha-(1:3)-fucosyltransferase C-like protein [Leptotrombidium deliense]